jgi:hypothetical protein
MPEARATPSRTWTTLLGTLWTPLNDMCNMWQM